MQFSHENLHIITVAVGDLEIKTGQLQIRVQLEIMEILMYNSKERNLSV